MSGRCQRERVSKSDNSEPWFNSKARQLVDDNSQIETCRNMSKHALERSDLMIIS